MPPSARGCRPNQNSHEAPPPAPCRPPAPECAFRRSGITESPPKTPAHQPLQALVSAGRCAMAGAGTGTFRRGHRTGPPGSTAGVFPVRRRHRSRRGPSRASGARRGLPAGDHRLPGHGACRSPGEPDRVPVRLRQGRATRLPRRAGPGSTGPRQAAAQRRIAACTQKRLFWMPPGAPRSWTDTRHNGGSGTSGSPEGNDPA